MRIRITVGDIDLRMDGLELSKRDVKGLLQLAAGYAAALSQPAEPERESTPIGFAAHIERAPDVVEDLSEWFEESP